MNADIEERLLVLALEERGRPRSLPRLDDAALRRRPMPPLPDEPGSTRNWWIAAATVIFGTLVWFAVRQLSSAPGQFATSQDPEAPQRPPHEILGRRGGPASQPRRLEELPADTAGLTLAIQAPGARREARVLADLEKLRRFKQLRSLRLAGSRSRVSVLYTNAEARSMTDQTCAALAELKQLQFLDLPPEFVLRRSALAQLATLPRLHQLRLEGRLHDASVLDALANAKSLRRLDLQLNLRQQAEPALRILTQLRGLRSLSFAPGKLGPLDALAGLKDLQELSLAAPERMPGTSAYAPTINMAARHPAIAAATIASLRSLPGLRRLDLSGRQLEEGADLMVLGELKQLRNLDLDATRIPHEVLTALPPSLIHLRACFGKVDAGILARLPGLLSLDVADSGFTDADLRTLRGGKLQGLGLGRCRRLSRASVEVLRTLPALQALDLSGLDWVDDGVLAELALIDSLRSLRLQGCDKITDKGLGHLTRLKNLRRLDLSQLPEIRNEGVAFLLEKGGPFELLRLEASPGVNPNKISRLLKNGEVDRWPLRDSWFRVFADQLP